MDGIDTGFSGRSALFINTTLTRSPGISHTQLLVDASASIMTKLRSSPSPRRGPRRPARPDRELRYDLTGERLAGARGEGRPRSPRRRPRPATGKIRRDAPPRRRGASGVDLPGPARGRLAGAGGVPEDRMRLVDRRIISSNPIRSVPSPASISSEPAESHFIGIDPEGSNEGAHRVETQRRRTHHG
jgi:hypothetical protein